MLSGTEYVYMVNNYLPKLDFYLHGLLKQQQQQKKRYKSSFFMYYNLVILQLNLLLDSLLLWAQHLLTLRLNRNFIARKNMLHSKEAVIFI